jgi:hypothetical protein
VLCEACCTYELQFGYIYILVGKLDRLKPLCRQNNYIIETHKTTHTHTHTYIQTNICLYLYVCKPRVFMFGMEYEDPEKITGKT